MSDDLVKREYLIFKSGRGWYRPDSRRDMFDEVAHPSDPMSVLLNTTLAELEGDKT